MQFTYTQVEVYGMIGDHKVLVATGVLSEHVAELLRLNVRALPGCTVLTDTPTDKLYAANTITTRLPESVPYLGSGPLLSRITGYRYLFREVRVELDEQPGSQARGA
jgi:hypothetical protein